MMGTLYNCLREVRLEKYYPAFRANGITCYEALASLTMEELRAMGISGAEDRRRFVELVNIIKSVNRSESSSGGAVPRKRHPGSPTPSSAKSALVAAGGAGSSSSQSEKKVPRRRPRSPPEGAVGGVHLYSSGMRLEPTRDVSVRERGPNFSVGSYLDMLDFKSDSSHSDGGDHLSDSMDGDSGVPSGRAPPPPPTFSARAPPRKLASADRIRSQTKSKGYNYGVPSSRDSPRSKGRGGGIKVTKDDRIRVCVRKRPPSRRESRAADPDIIEAQSTTTVIVKEPKVAVDLTAFTMKHEFVFDEVFDELCSNEDVYIRAARPLIAKAFQRSNATFFAYGQTGAGKTHTMIGTNGVPGLYQLAAQDVFDIMASGQHGTDLLVWVSFFEIYCGQLFDLLNRRNRLVAREDGAQRVCIAGLTETEVPDVHTLVRVLQFGNSVRSRGTSGVNPDSSRSHAVLQMEIRHADETHLGKISFIDLAGSERASDMGDPDRQTRMEGAEINQSLLALKECIRSIDQESRHTPFRQSKLTHILKDAFVGNSRTCMIANVSPVQSACEHTLNTLRYADRVKELRRDSSQSTGGASFGQAMNLLMNIPITAPSIFHPSNVLSTSTPVRPRLHDHPHSAASDITLDPSETPIRGHNVVPKSASKIRSKAQADGHSGQSKPRPSTGSRLPSGAAASQGLLPPHPEASPSESDHTDTDSNNVTHPTETRPVPSVPNIPVINSTDTEFDFPTSDFNNVDEQLNDLSQGGNNLSRDGDKTKKVGVTEDRRHLDDQGQDQVLGDQASAASASGPRSESQKPQTLERRVSNPSPINQLSSRSSNKSQGDRQSPSPASKQNKNSPPSSEKAPASQIPNAVAPKTPVNELGYVPPVTSKNKFSLGPLSDSFDDEMLFGGPGEANSPKQESQTSSASGGSASGQVNKQLMKALPAVQTALSSDLTSFSQRSPLKGGLERTTSNPSPRGAAEVHLPCNVSPSPRHEEGVASARGGSKEPPSPGRGWLPSPSSAAIKDWVSSKAEEPGSVRSNRRRAEKQVDRADPASAQPSNLPFAAYSVADASPHNPSTVQERLQGKSGSQTHLTANVGDSPSSTKVVVSQGLSGPSSDPIVPNFATASTYSAKDTGTSSSSSLPTHSSTGKDMVLESHNRNVSSDGSPSASVFTATKTTSSSALVTEKLMSGAVFSPIHPQPVSTTGMQTTLKRLAMGGSDSNIVHPTPVSGVLPMSASTTVMSSASFSVAERDQARISLVGYHEDQLAAITSLCKQEMKLLLNAKKAVPRSFDDYISRVSGILSQKMLAIQQLQDHIRDYQGRFSLHPLSPPATASSDIRAALPPT